MLNWIPIAIGSYFLNALASVIDKALLTRRLPQPLSYAFYTGVTSIGVVILLPFISRFEEGRSFGLLSPFEFGLSFIAGATFIVALFFFYVAIKHCETTRVVPLVFGVFTPVFTLLGSWWFVLDTLTGREFLAFTLFLIGGLVLMVERSKGFLHLNMMLLGNTFLAGLFFSVSFTSAKALFDIAEGFLTPFIWMRIMSVVFALLLLLTPWRSGLVSAGGKMNLITFGFFMVNKTIGAIGFLMFNLAIKIGPVSLVNALKGIEYFFVFIIIGFASLFLPRIVKEPFTFARVAQKVLGILIISGGLWVLNIGEVLASVL